MRLDFIANFADGENPPNYAIMDHFPDLKQSLESHCANMHSSAQVSHEKESKVKYLVAQVQSQLQRIFQAVIMGYEGSQIAIEFDVISCD